MALTTAQTRIARLALALPEAAGFVLTGGGAMLAYGLVDRPTRDLDLFTTDPAALAPFAAALELALAAAGLSVTRGRVATAYQQLMVVDGGETVLVELAHDARLWPSAMLTVGPVLIVEETRRRQDAGAVRQGRATRPGRRRRPGRRPWHRRVTLPRGCQGRRVRPRRARRRDRLRRRAARQPLSGTRAGTRPTWGAAAVGPDWRAELSR